MRNYRGELAECTQSNFFIVRGRRGADAAARRRAAARASPGVPVRGGRRRRQSRCARDAAARRDLFGADEAFLTSTTRELRPVVRIDDRTIGTGKPGPVTLEAAGEISQATRG